MEISASWVSAISEVVIAVGLGLTFWQFRADHARSRRERAVALVGEWAQCVLQRASSARKFTERLTNEQTLALWNQESFKIDEKLFGLVDSALERTAPSPVGGLITLSEEQSAEIRWQVVSYLNKLEVVLAAWRHNVADREMLAEQFHFLVSPKENQYILERFREVSGQANTYPSIADFVHFLRTKQLPERGKKKI
jgi:hypothetical protein